MMITFIIYQHTDFLHSCVGFALLQTLSLYFVSSQQSNVIEQLKDNLAYLSFSSIDSY